MKKNDLISNSTHAENTSNHPKSIYVNIAEETVKIAIVGTSVATALLPADALMHYLHTKNKAQTPAANVFPSSGSNARSSIFYATGKSLAKAYSSSVQAAMIKTGVLGQRGTVGEVVASRRVQQEELAITDSITESVSDMNASHANEMQSKSKNRLTLQESMMVAGLMGSVDTGLTQYHANMRTWGFEKTRKPEFEFPEVKSVQDKANVFKAGIGARASRNIANVAGFVVMPLVKDKLDPLIPESHYIDTSEAAAIIASGATTGVVTNAIDIAYKNQILRIDPKTLKTPPLTEVVTDLAAKQGARAFGRGLAASVGYTVLAQAIVPAAEDLAAQIVPKVSSNVSSFFSGTKQTMQDQRVMLDQTKDSPCPFSKW